MIRTLRLIPLACLAVLPALSPAAHADDVYLKNGRSFAGVIAQVSGSKVRIQLPYGEMTLPLDHVLRIEKIDSVLQEYLARKAALEPAGDRPVGELARAWLDLGLWARANGLDHGLREAALMAARLDPQLDGLAPVLRSFGYVFDQDLGSWIPYGDAMRRRGFVFDGQQWVGREELAERQRLAEQEAARRRAERQAADLAQATENLRAATELVLVRNSLEPVYPPQTVWGVPVAVWSGGFFLPPANPHAGRRGDRGHPGHQDRPAPPADRGPHHLGTLGGAHTTGGRLPPDTVPGRLNPGAFPTPGKLPLH